MGKMNSVSKQIKKVEGNIQYTHAVFSVTVPLNLSSYSHNPTFSSRKHDLKSLQDPFVR